MSLLGFLDQVFEVVKGCNGGAASVIDESSVFSCDPEVNSALDALKGDAAATPFGCQSLIGGRKCASDTDVAEK